MSKSVGRLQLFKPSVDNASFDVEVRIGVSDTEQKGDARGTIEVGIECGNGSTYYLRLPLAELMKQLLEHLE